MRTLFRSIGLLASAMLASCNPCWAQSELHLQASNYQAERCQALQLEYLTYYRADLTPDAVKQSLYSVAMVDVAGARGSGTYLGDGLWLTNSHVIEGQRNATITLKTASGPQVAAGQVIADGRRNPDCAIIQTANVDHLVRPVPVADRQPQPGDVVYPSGYDHGELRAHSLWPARVVRMYDDGYIESVGVDQRKGSISGNSGGPTFNSLGELIAPLFANGSASGTQTGAGTTITVGYLPCRTFLLPFRERLIRSLERTQCPPNRSCPPQMQYAQPQQIPPQQMIPLQPIGGQAQLPSFQPPAAQPQVCQPGPKGDKGDKGDPGEITAEHLEIIAARVAAVLRNDPSMRGPAGPAGADGVDASVDIDRVAASVLAKLPPIKVALVDGKTKKIIDQEQYRLGETIAFDINQLIHNR